MIRLTLNALTLLALCSMLHAAPDIITIPITWDWPEVDITEHTLKRPWLNLRPQRVDIDLSLDDGATYRNIATGIPSQYGTSNTYNYTFISTPETITMAARVRIRQMDTVADPYYPSIGQAFKICDIHLINPPATVTNGTTATISWVAAGADNWVRLGTKSGTDPFFVPQAVLANTDSNQGAVTNTAQWEVANIPVGLCTIVLQSIADSDISRLATVKVVN